VSRGPYAPWKVYARQLRSTGIGSNKKVIEIHDAIGQVIVCWGGFESVDFSYTQSLKNARRMVKAVNSALENKS